jgi:capsular polysaccharide export protein
MARRILLLYNTPKAKRYFTALRDNVRDLDIRVRPVLVARSSSPTESDRVNAIAEYALRRQRARHHRRPWQRRLLEHGYRLAARGHYHWSRREIERAQPDAVGVWGGQAVDARGALEAADALGVPRYTFETGLLPRTTTCDPRGVNFDNSVPRDPSFYAAYHRSAELPQSLQQRPSRRRHQRVELPRDYVFVPFQVRLDSQILMYSPWIRDMQHFFTVATEAWRVALADRGIELVFKMHPSCVETYPDLQAAAVGERGVMFANANTSEELIRGARGVITVNSTVGIEALLMGKPVLTTGQACYAIPGVAGHAGTIAEVIDWMGRLAEDEPPPSEHRESFLQYLANDYCIPDPYKSPGPRHFQAIAARLSDTNRLVPASEAREDSAQERNRASS